MAEPGISLHQMYEILANMLLVFGIAGIIVPLLQRIRVSPILGYLICGIIIGPPYGLAELSEMYPAFSVITINQPEKVHMLGELGIVTLMFMIGLELSFDRLKELKTYIFGLGTLQITLCALAIYAVATYFGNSMEASVLIGASLALSSTAIAMQLLEDRKLINRRIGTICFSILLMQDLAVVPILVLVSSFSGNGDGQSIAEALAIALGVGVCTVAVIFVVGKKLMGPLLRFISTSNSPEWLAAFTVFIVIACSAITQSAGLSLALGAFLAGLLIAETEFKHEVEVIVSPLKGLLLGIFFLSVGMMINIEEILRQPLLLAVSVVGIFAIKTAILFPLCLLFKIPGRKAAKTAIYLSQPGEFALLILGAAMAENVMPAEHVQFFLLVTALSMMVTPLVYKLAPFAGRLASRVTKDAKEEDDIPMLAERVVIIAGFGRVGQLLGNALEEQQIAYLGFDQNVDRVRALKRQGFRVIYGDARRIELWHRLHSGNVIAAVIAIDDHTASYSILKSIRSQWPFLPVIVRAKDTGDMDHFYDAGAKYVVAETLESSLSVARLLMKLVGTEEKAIEKIVHKLREQTIATT